MLAGPCGLQVLADEVVFVNATKGSVRSGCDECATAGLFCESTAKTFNVFVWVLLWRFPGVQHVRPINPATNVSVPGNTVNGGCVGVLEGPNTFLNGSLVNTLLNTITQVQTGSDLCTQTTPQIAARTGGRQHSARRPSPKL